MPRHTHTATVAGRTFTRTSETARYVACVVTTGNTSQERQLLANYLTPNAAKNWAGAEERLERIVAERRASLAVAEAGTEYGVLSWHKTPAAAQTAAAKYASNGWENVQVVGVDQ